TRWPRDWSSDVCSSDLRRDRPLVVVAEEDERRAHHRREVRALVERALRGGAVAEVHDRDRALSLQLLSPGESGGVRDVRRDRDRSEERRVGKEAGARGG